MKISHIFFAVLQRNVDDDNVDGVVHCSVSNIMLP